VAALLVIWAAAEVVVATQIQDIQEVAVKSEQVSKVDIMCTLHLIRAGVAVVPVVKAWTVAPAKVLVQVVQVLVVTLLAPQYSMVVVVVQHNTMPQEQRRVELAAGEPAFMQALE
jgi:hypothetical protein